MTSESCLPNVINLGNSIIGVSILAMPYCFQKCGIFLSILLIIISGLLTKATCHLLLKSAIMERRRNFEFLAFHTFGTIGKFAVEFGIIGFLLGSCIAFFVVIGDLSPPLFSEFFLLDNTPHLRLELMLFIGFFIALPLGLLRRVESLTSFSTISVGFYIFLAFKILSEAWPNFSYDKFISEMIWWRPAGLLSSLPIFAMALSCQTQLFEIFDTVNEPSLKRMDTVVRNAVNMCSSVYILVGLFGYIAFYDSSISGNVLVKLESTIFSKLVKLAFVTTVIVSFPLCLFPCRTSLHSLIYKSGVHDTTGEKMAENRFRFLTFLLVLVTVGTAIMLPNIEFVLGILGSTIGTTVCFILPSLIFIRNTSKDTNERLLAKVVFSIGVFMLVACSYTTLQDSARKAELQRPLIATLKTPIVHLEMPQIAVNEVSFKGNVVSTSKEKLLKASQSENLAKKAAVSSAPETKLEKRQEPPVPQEPDETIKIKPAEVLKTKDEETKKVGDDSIIKRSKNDVLDEEALKKEDKELSKKEDEVSKKKDEKNDADLNKKQDELLKKIEEQQLEQKKMLEEQRKILEELKEHKEMHIKEDVKENLKTEASVQAEAKKTKTENIEKKNLKEDSKMDKVKQDESNKKIVESDAGKAEVPRKLTIPQFLPQVGKKGKKKVVRNGEYRPSDVKQQDVLEKGIASKNGYIRGSNQRVQKDGQENRKEQWQEETLKKKEEQPEMGRKEVQENGKEKLIEQLKNEKREFAAEQHEHLVRAQSEEVNEHIAKPPQNDQQPENLIKLAEGQKQPVHKSTSDGQQQSKPIKQQQKNIQQPEQTGQQSNLAEQLQKQENAAQQLPKDVKEPMKKEHNVKEESEKLKHRMILMDSQNAKVTIPAIKSETGLPHTLIETSVNGLPDLKSNRAVPKNNEVVANEM